MCRQRTAKNVMDPLFYRGPRFHYRQERESLGQSKRCATQAEHDGVQK